MNIHINFSKEQQIAAIVKAGHKIETHEFGDWRDLDHTRSKWVVIDTEGVKVDGLWYTIEESFKAIFNEKIEQHIINLMT